MAVPAVHGTLPFPLPSDLNTRLRRVITGYQRSHKREQLKQEQKAKVGSHDVFVHHNFLSDE